MEHRTCPEIIAEILNAAMEGAKKTHIVYKANLNHAILKNYLNRLEKQGLITKETESGSMIRTTRKGLQYVEQYRTLQVLANF